MNIGDIEKKVIDYWSLKTEEYWGRRLLYDTRRLMKYTLNILIEKKPRTVLDVGCGPGIFTYFLSKFSYVISIDIAISMIKKARKKAGNVNTDFIVADASYMPLRSSSIDYVVAYRVLEYLPDLMKGFIEIRRTLRREGVASIQLPSKTGFMLLALPSLILKLLSEITKYKFVISLFEASSLRNYYTPSQLIKYLKGSNLALIYITGYELNPFAVIQATLLRHESKLSRIIDIIVDKLSSYLESKLSPLLLAVLSLNIYALIMKR